MYNQEEVVLGTLGIMATDDKPALLQMLKESGSLVTELSTREEILDASVKALMSSDRFRKSLTSYIAQANREYNTEENMFSYAVKYDPSTGKGGTRFGNFLRNTFTPEVNQKILGGVIDYASASLNAKANRESNKTATDYANAEANRLDREATLSELRGRSTSSAQEPTRRRWVLPVVIGVGVILIGTTIYLMRKK